MYKNTGIGNCDLVLVFGHVGGSIHYDYVDFIAHVTRGP
jgi:tetrahydromethanopterin S-methyltransferase subunit H